MRLAGRLRFTLDAGKLAVGDAGRHLSVSGKISRRCWISVLPRAMACRQGEQQLHQGMLDLLLAVSTLLRAIHQNFGGWRWYRDISSNRISTSNEPGNRHDFELQEGHHADFALLDGKHIVEKPETGS